MTRELTGLKCRAIAVTVPENFCFADISMIHGVFPCLYINTYEDIESDFEEQPMHVDLPPGEWEVLGRVNDLHIFSKFKLVQSYNSMQEGDYLYLTQEWQSYCAANGLTNELILIEK